MTIISRLAIESQLFRGFPDRLGHLLCGGVFNIARLVEVRRDFKKPLALQILGCVSDRMYVVYTN